MKKYFLIFFILPFMLFCQVNSIKKINIDGFQLNQPEIFYTNNLYHLFFRTGKYFLKATTNSLDGQWTITDTIPIALPSSTVKLWDLLKVGEDNFYLAVNVDLTIKIYFSSNFGQSWSLINTIGNLPMLTGNSEITLTQTKQNEICVSYKSYSQRVYYLFSTDFGITWSQPYYIYVTTNAQSFTMNSLPDGNYLALWTRSNDIAFSISSNGINWADHRFLLSDGSIKSIPIFYKGNSESIKIFFNKLDTIPTTTLTEWNVYFVESTNNGNSWNGPYKITKNLTLDSLVSVFDDNEGTKILFVTDRFEVSSFKDLAILPAVSNSDSRTKPILISFKILFINSLDKFTFKIKTIDVEPFSSVYVNIKNEIFELFDDGQHFDGDSGDYVFGGIISETFLNDLPIIKSNNFKLFFDNIGIMGSPFGIYKSLFDTVFITINKFNDFSYTFTRQINFDDLNQFEEGDVLFSTGFTLTGYDNSFLWANGVVYSWVLRDYQPGKFGSNPNDPKNKIYRIMKNDPPFGQSWQEWRDAVSLGAYFYDGDGDGVYNPIDKNGNGIWDPDEDMPDILGDETLWMIFNDSVSASNRRYTDVYPLGIEIRHTIFASKRPGLNQTIFSRYSILNTGAVNQVLDSIVFSVFADADIGDFTDDLSGTDTLLNSSYSYNHGSDTEYGINPPAVFQTFLQLPWTSTGNNNDTAYNHLGKLLGKRTIIGSKHTNLIASIQIYGIIDIDPPPANRFELRNFSMGRDRYGRLINPCTFLIGQVYGVDCNLVNPVYFYSGDPVTRYGWINTVASDTRTLLSAGPFRLEANKPVDIIVAHTVGRGTDSLNSITVARELVQEVLNEYRSNFSTITSIDDKQPVDIPKEFRLHQNYPNPFNSKTKIEFSIPKSGEVKLILYDALGREIATLINERREAGNYVYEFNANKLKLSSGVYFYKLKNEENFQTKKMIYLK